MLKVRTGVLTFLNLVKTDFRILTDSVFWRVHCQDGERILVAHLTSTTPHSPADYSRSSAQIHVSWFLFGRKCSFFSYLARWIPNNTFCVGIPPGCFKAESQNPAPGLFAALLLFYCEGKEDEVKEAFHKDGMKFSSREGKFSNGVRRSTAGISVLSDLIRLSLLNNSLGRCCDFTLIYKARGVLGSAAAQL